MKTFTVTFTSKSTPAAKHPDKPAQRIVTLQAKDKEDAAARAQASENRWSYRMLRDTHKQLSDHASEIGVDVNDLSDPTDLAELKKAVAGTRGHDKGVLTNVEINEKRADLGDWELESVEAYG